MIMHRHAARLANTPRTNSGPERTGVFSCAAAGAPPFEEDPVWVIAAIGLRRGVLGLLAPLALLSNAAQSQGHLRGVVTDSAGAAIPSADVGIVAARLLVRTDEQGRFTFRRVPLGVVEVSIRRLGYTPVRVRQTITGAENDSMVIIMVEQAEVLQAMTVSPSDRRQRQAIEEFYRRRTVGLGTYITREEILLRRASVPSDVFRDTPGIRLVRVRGSVGIRFNASAAMRRDCVPMIWLDGQRAPQMEIDDLPLNDIEGIELYNGASTTPMQFSQSSLGTTCGTIVVWSRVPGA